MPNSEVWNLCEEYFEWRLAEYPEFSTFCGQHDYDDRLNDHSSEAFARRLVSNSFISTCIVCGLVVYCNYKVKCLVVAIVPSRRHQNCQRYSTVNSWFK